MASDPVNQILQHLRRVGPAGEGEPTDRQLLEDFTRGDRAALEAIVRRHGPMVWGVCRRALASSHDAEDAFQATFLVLVRKAGSIRSAGLLANWLYGVALQTTRKARQVSARRQARERQVTEMPEPTPGPSDRDVWTDLQPLFDEELGRLPDKYRAVIVLCELEGKTRPEVARQLGLPEGTVGSRLARARALLAKRLARRGVTVSSAALAALLPQHAAAAVPEAVVSTTLECAARLAMGGAAAAGTIPAPVCSLTEGVLKSMFLTKLKVGTLLVLGAVGAAGSAALVYEYAAAGPLGPAAVKPENGPPRDGKDAKDPGERWRQAARRPNLSDREKAAYEQLAQVHRCAFPNVGRSARSFLDLRKDSTGPMNVLYRMGFDVLPQLAEALDDTTPTRTITPIRPEILRANEEPKKKVWPVNELVARLIVEIAERDFVTDREQEPKFPAELRDLNLLGIRDLNAQPGAPADFTKAVLAWYAANRDKTPAERKIADVNDRWFSNRLEAIRWVGEHPSKEGRRAVEKRVDALLEEAKERPNTTLWSEMSECAEALGKVGDKEGLAPVRAVCDYLSSDDRWAAGGVGPARRTLFDAFHGLARFGEKDEAQRRLKAVYEKWQDRMAGDPDKAADLLERAGRW